jgi:hypothetical protein
MTPTIKPNCKTTFHRDGTVSYWNVFEAQWCRATPLSLFRRGEIMSSLPEGERGRITHLACLALAQD